MSFGSESRPIGIVAMNFLRLSGIGHAHERFEQGGRAHHRADRVDTNVVGPEFDGERLAHQVHRAISGTTA